MGAMASQITSLTSVYSIVYSGVYQRKHQSSASLAFVGGIHRGPVNSPHKGPVTRKMFLFDEVIMRLWHLSRLWVFGYHYGCCFVGFDADYYLVTADCHHDDAIKWKHFPRYWPFVRGIHPSLVISPHKGQWQGALMLSLICVWMNWLSKQWWGWWFETPSHPL